MARRLDDGVAGEKVASTKNALDVETKDDDGTHQSLLFTTTVKGKQYLTLKGLGKEAQEDRKGAYDIYQYRFLDNNTLEVRGMAPDVLEKAIGDKKLAGTIDKGNGPIITDTPEGMARYLEAHADECYPLKTDYMLTFKRQK